MMMTVKWLTLAVSMVIVGTGYSARLDDCGSKSGQLFNLDVTGCTFDDTDAPCILWKGRNAGLTASFQTNGVTDKTTVKVWGILMKTVEIPFAIEPDACKHWGVSCPVEAHVNSTLAIELPVRNEYPSIPVQIKLALLDSNNENIFCVKFPAHLQSAKAKLRIKMFQG